MTGESLLGIEEFLGDHRWKTVQLTPDLVPQRNSLEQHPSVGADSLPEPSGIWPRHESVFSILAGHPVGFFGHENAELALAVVGGVYEHHFAAEGAPRKAGPADQLEGRPTLKLKPN